MNIGTLVAFAIVCAGVLVLRVVNPNAKRPFRAPLLPLFSIAGAVSCLYLVTGLELATFKRYAIWFAIGIVVYALYGFRKSRLRDADEPAPQRRFSGGPRGNSAGVTIGSAVSDRFELITVPRSRGVPSFADDVARGLGSEPKRLPSKYFYDDVGSALFDAITRLPEYYLTRAETEILSRWGWQMVRLLDAPVDFLELGSGSAIKTRILIGEALRVQTDLCYSPIDISVEAVRASSLALVEAYPRLRGARVRRRLLRRVGIAGDACRSARCSRC